MSALGTKLGALTAAQFWSSTSGTAHDGDGRVIYDTNDGRLFYDSNGNKAGGAIQIAVLTGHPTVLAADILIV